MMAIQKLISNCLTRMSAYRGKSRISTILIISSQFLDMMLSMKSLALLSIILVTNAVNKVAWVGTILASQLHVPVKLRMRVQRLIRLMTVIHTVLNHRLFQSCSPLVMLHKLAVLHPQSQRAANIQKTKSQIMHAVKQLQMM